MSDGQVILGGVISEMTKSQYCKTGIICGSKLAQDYIRRSYIRI